MTPLAPATTFSAPGPALTALREATSIRHARVDRLLDLPKMASRQHYGHVLQAFEAFLAPWEEDVARALPADRRPWLRQRSRLALLRDDLRVLGLPRLDEPARRVRLHDAASAWGSLYVMEGSALGGQLITRTVAAHGLVPAAGAAFFHGWGPATGGMWREFRHLLETMVVSPEDIAAACQGAAATFDALAASFEDHLHERTAAA